MRAEASRLRRRLFAATLCAGTNKGERVTRLAVPVLTLIGREKVATNSSDDALLIEAEAMIADAMRPD